jgi:hypothetical protein
MLANEICAKSLGPYLTLAEAPNNLPAYLKRTFPIQILNLGIGMSGVPNLGCWLVGLREGIARLTPEQALNSILEYR